METIKRVVLLLAIGLVVGGSKACREDYCVACNANLGTTTATITETPSETPSQTPTGTITITPTPTMTNEGPSTNPPEEQDMSKDLFLGLRSLSNESLVSSVLNKEKNVNKTENWLGRIAYDDTDTDGMDFVIG